MQPDLESSVETTRKTEGASNAPCCFSDQRTSQRRKDAGCAPPVITDDALPLPTLREAAEAYMVWHTRHVSDRSDRSTASRVQFWIDCPGDRSWPTSGATTSPRRSRDVMEHRRVIKCLVRHGS